MIEQEKTTDFKIYGDIDLNKSCTGCDTEDDYWFVQGMILTGNKDTVAETPILKSMDWSYFDKQGLVKYEHDINGPSPETIIAIPHIRKSHANGEWLRVRLLPRPIEELKKGLKKDYARETAALIKTMNEHNKEFPGHARSIGWSVEGKYLSKSQGGKYVGQVLNVVLTPSPVDTETYAEMAKSHNTALFKSLTTGYAHSPETQTGGSALRTESVDGVKSQINFNNNKRGSKMKFETFDKAKDHYLGEGLSEEDAMKKARELFPENEVVKSFNEKTNLLQKSVEALTKQVAKVTDLFKSQSVKPGDNKKNSEENSSDGNEPVDITDVFEGMKKSVQDVGSMVSTGNLGVADTLSKIAECIVATGEMVKSQNQENVELKKSLEAQGLLLKAIAKNAGHISTFDLDSEKLDGEGKPKMNKSVVLNKLIDLVKSEKISDIEVTKYEMTGQLSPQIAALPEFQ